MLTKTIVTEQKIDGNTVKAKTTIRIPETQKELASLPFAAVQACYAYGADLKARGYALRIAGQGGLDDGDKISATNSHLLALLGDPETQGEGLKLVAERTESGDADRWSVQFYDEHLAPETDTDDDGIVDVGPWDESCNLLKANPDKGIVKN